MIEHSVTGLQRNTIDKYYTTYECAGICVNLIKNTLNISDKDIGVEPSAGNGVFLPYMKDIFKQALFYDIKPEHKEIILQDYLDFQSDKIPQIAKADKIHVLGNPPFGRQSSMAIKFIKKSCQFCDTLSFILPKSFKKDSMKKYIPLSFHLLCEVDLPHNSFTVNNKPHHVPCVFQIWEKQSIDRIVSPQLKPYGFKFVKKHETPDISVRRVGVYAGKIDREIETKSSQSHYFIQLDKSVTDVVLDKLNDIEYDHKNDTVGPRSISKQEIIIQFNDVLQT
jgi:hypothetical protein